MVYINSSIGVSKSIIIGFTKKKYYNWNRDQVLVLESCQWFILMTQFEFCKVLSPLQ
jgi:hypothetical protein